MARPKPAGSARGTAAAAAWSVCHPTRRVFRRDSPFLDRAARKRCSGGPPPATSGSGALALRPPRRAAPLRRRTRRPLPGTLVTGERWRRAVSRSLSPPPRATQAAPATMAAPNYASGGARAAGRLVFSRIRSRRAARAALCGGALPPDSAGAGPAGARSRRDSASRRPWERPDSGPGRRPPTGRLLSAPSTPREHRWLAAIQIHARWRSSGALSTSQVRAPPQLSASAPDRVTDTTPTTNHQKYTLREG